MSIVSRRWFAALFAIGGFLLVQSGFGLYYERYEAVFSVLASGQLTPELPYDNFFYLAHTLLIKAYAMAYGVMSGINWLSVIQLGYLLVALGVILNVFRQQGGPASLVLLCHFILITLLFSEHFVNFIYTRVSFILSFAALLALSVDSERGHRSINSRIIYSVMFLIAVLTRAESAALMLIIVMAFHFLVVIRNPILERVKRTFMLFGPLSIMPVAVFVWMQYEIGSSQEFYKVIEPEVEYELTARNNIVPLSYMINGRDSLRYMAIDRVMWGDATTNNAEFLRSLIGRPDSNPNLRAHVMSRAFSSLRDALEMNIVVVVLAMLLLSILVIRHVAHRDHGAAIGTVAFIAFLSVLVTFVSYRVKMTGTAVSCIFFSATILGLSQWQKERHWRWSVNGHALALTALFSVFQLFSLRSQAVHLRERTAFFRQGLAILKARFGEHDILLNGESKHLLYAFTPLQPFSVEPFGKLLLYDSQHISTIEPYRSYLAMHCNCDPNNYAEYFSFLQQGGDTNVFLMSEDFRIFLEQYLMVVHDLPLTFTKALDRAIVEQDDRFSDRAIWAYTIIE